MRKRLIGALFALFLPFLSVADELSDAAGWLADGVEAYERHDYGRAKLSLEKTLALDPHIAEAYILKALLHHRDGQDDKAEAALKRALDLNPKLPERYRARLQAHAHRLEAQLTKQEFAHFELQFHGADRRNDAWQAVKTLEEAYTELGSRFNYFPTKRFPVVIFTNQEFYDAWRAPFWMGGFFDGKDGIVRVCIEDAPGGPRETRQRLRHEFTHAFLYRYGKMDEFPYWFAEGVAEYYGYLESSNGFWKDNRLEELRKMLKGAPWLTLTQMEQALLHKNVSPQVLWLAYMQARGLILYVAKQRGDTWIPRLINRMKQGDTFAQAFDAVVGVPPEKMLDGLHRLF